MFLLVFWLSYCVAGTQTLIFQFPVMLISKWKSKAIPTSLIFRRFLYLTELQYWRTPRKLETMLFKSREFWKNNSKEKSNWKTRQDFKKKVIVHMIIPKPTELT